MSQPQESSPPKEDKQKSEKQSIQQSQLSKESKQFSKQQDSQQEINNQRKQSQVRRASQQQQQIIVNPNENQSQAHDTDHLDPNLANGPLEKRQYTDIAFSIIFVIFWISLIALTLYATSGVGGISDGENQEPVTKPQYMQFWKKSKFQSIYEYLWQNQGSFKANSDQVFFNLQKIIKYFDNEKGIMLNLEQDEQIEQNEDGEVTQISNQQIIDDLVATVPVHLGVLLFTMILAILFVIILPLCTATIVWTMIIGFGTILLFAGIYLLMESYNLSSQEMYTNYQTIGFVLIIITIIYAIVIWCFRERISNSIQLIEGASNFVKQNKLILFVPFLTFLFLVIFILFWGYSLVVLSDCKYLIFFMIFQVPPEQSGMYYLIFYLQLFGLFWSIEVCMCFCIFAVAQGASLWYFIPNEHKENKNGQNQQIAMGTVFRNSFMHFGSICYGALILAIIGFVRYLVEQARNDEKGSALKQCILFCVSCCLDCLETLVRHLSKLAFIMMALQGDDFCLAAKIGFTLVVQQMDEVLNDYIILQYCSGFFMTISTVFLMAVGTIFGLFLLMSFEAYAEMSWLVPILIFLLITYAVAALFMFIYGMSADTLLFSIVAEYVVTGSTDHCPECMSAFRKNKLYSAINDAKNFIQGGLTTLAIKAVM